MDILRFVLIIGTALTLLILSNTKLKTQTARIYISSLVFSVTFFSGIGLVDREIDSIFMIKFIVYITILILSAYNVIVFKVNKKFEFSNSLIFKDNKRLIMIASLIYLFSFFVYLITPVFRLDLVIFPFKGQIDLYKVMENTYKSDNIWKITGYFQIFLQPLYFIYLYILATKKKYIQITFYYISWIYLMFLKSFYLGRGSMVIFIILFLVFLLFTRNQKLEISGKHILYVILLMILLIPFFIYYQYVRMGIQPGNIDFVTSINKLIEIELTFPKYYERITSLKELSPLVYILYVLFLPFPSIIWPGKPTIFINDTFTYMMLGLVKGSPKYYVILPSILGESMLIFGSNFYWIHAIILGVIIGFIWRVLSINKYFMFINIYYGIQLITIGRGGSQSWIPDAINGLIPLLFWTFILNFIKKRDLFRR